MAKKVTTPKPVAKKAPARKDTTVITPRYKVTAKEIDSNVASVIGPKKNRIGATVIIPHASPKGKIDTTRTKIAANSLNVTTTHRRNQERAMEGKKPIPFKSTIPGSWVEPKGKNWKDRPIITTRTPKKK